VGGGGVRVRGGGVLTLNLTVLGHSEKSPIRRTLE